MASKSSSKLVPPLLGFLAGVAITGASALFLASQRKPSAVRRRSSGKHSTRNEEDKDFKLNENLSQGNVVIGKLPLCQVLLCDDSRYPTWLILVPRKNSMREIIDLSEENQVLLWKEVACALRVIKDNFKTDKLNVSAVGNMCPQLHIHVTGRQYGDAGWPSVHLGTLGRPNQTDKLQEIRQRLIQGFQNDGEFHLLVEDDDESLYGDQQDPADASDYASASDHANDPEPADSPRPVNGTDHADNTDLPDSPDPARGSEPANGSDPVTRSDPANSPDLAGSPRHANGSDPATRSDLANPSYPANGSKPANGSDLANDASNHSQEAEAKAEAKPEAEEGVEVEPDRDVPHGVLSEIDMNRTQLPDED